MAHSTGFSSNFHAVKGKGAKKAADSKNRESLLTRLNAALYRALEAEFNLFKI